MNTIQKTSMLICIAILLLFAAVGIVAKWPLIEQWYASASPGSSSATQVGADPFAYDPPLPSKVKDLYPDYTIKASLLTNEAKIKGSMKLVFDNPRTTDLRLFLYDYPWSPTTITAIRHDDQPLTFQRRNSVILFPNRFAGEKRTTLTIEFETNVPRGGTRFGVRDDIWTLTNWYPMLGALNQKGFWYEPPERASFGDPFIYQFADYDVTFSSPEGYQWVTSGGRGEERNVANGRQEVRYQAKNILNFSLVGSPLYKVETIMFAPNLKVEIASTSQQQINRIKAIAEEVFPVYIEKFGPLPYPNVAIAETNTFTHAMEYANLAIFRRNLFAYQSVDHWLPHEIAHLWWYNSVATLEASTGWVDEGLVEFSVYYYNQKRYGQASADQVLKKYQRDADLLKRQYPDGRLAKELNQFATNDEFSWTWYAKGATMYDYLRRQIGEEKFAEFLQRVQRNYQRKLIGPEHLDQALGQTLHGEARYFVPNVQRLNQAGLAPVSVEYYVDIIINGMSFYPTVPARKQQDTVYIPLREVMEKLGYRIEWSEEKQAIRLRAGSNDLLVQKGSDQVRLGEKTYKLSKPVTELKDYTMVPLDLFQDVLKYRTEYNAETRIVSITVQSGKE